MERLTFSSAISCCLFIILNLLIFYPLDTFADKKGKSEKISPKYSALMEKRNYPALSVGPSEIEVEEIKPSIPSSPSENIPNENIDSEIETEAPEAEIILPAVKENIETREVVPLEIPVTEITPSVKEEDVTDIKEVDQMEELPEKLESSISEETSPLQEENLSEIKEIEQTEQNEGLPKSLDSSISETTSPLQEENTQEIKEVEQKEDQPEKNERTLKSQTKPIFEDLIIPESLNKEPDKNTQSPDIVLTNTLKLSLYEVIVGTLRNNVDIAVQEFNSKIRSQKIFEEDAAFDPTISFEAKHQDNSSQATNAFANPSKVQSNAQILELGLNQKLKLGTEYEVSLQGQRDETNSAFAGLNAQYTSRLALQVTQPLLKNFGSDINKTNIYLAKNNLDISDFDFKRTVIDTISTAENTYWDLVFSLEDLKVQNKSVERAQDLERRVRAQVDVGTLAPLEILQAQSEVASREEAVIGSQKLIQDNEDNIKNILNISFDTPKGKKNIRPVDSPRFIQEPPYDLNMSIEKALNYRPDFQSKKKELDNKNIQVQFNKNQLYPSLDLVGSLSLNGVSGRARAVSLGGGPPITNPFGGDVFKSFDRAIGGDFKSWEAGIVFKYPLGNKAAKSRYTAAKLEAAQLLLDLKNLEKTIVLEVREAIRQIETDKKRVQAAGVARKLAQEKLNAEEKKFEVGLSTSFNVLEFQTDLAEEQSKELKAIVDYNKSKINLRKVMGVTLDHYKIKYLSKSKS